MKSFIFYCWSLLCLIGGYYLGIHDYKIEHPNPYPADGETYYEYNIYKTVGITENGVVFISRDTVAIDTIWYPPNFKMVRY